MFTQLTLIYPVITMVQGFLLCAGLIIAIGPQNLFILRQGLQRRHLLLTALLCTLFDLVLIGLGVGGVGAAPRAHGSVLRSARGPPVPRAERRCVEGWRDHPAHEERDLVLAANGPWHRR